jgi:hypothetical protein
MASQPQQRLASDGFYIEVEISIGSGIAIPHEGNPGAVGRDRGGSLFSWQSRKWNGFQDRLFLRLLLPAPSRGKHGHKRNHRDGYDGSACLEPDLTTVRGAIFFKRYFGNDGPDW